MRGGSREDSRELKREGGLKGRAQGEGSRAGLCQLKGWLVPNGNGSLLIGIYK